MSHSIFEYTDYRLFLKECFAAEKGGLNSLSPSKMAQKIGMSSSLLKMILTRKRNISGKHLLKIATALNFNDSERNFFETLVRENQAESEEERRFYRRRLKQVKSQNKVTTKLVPKNLSLTSWFTPALLLYLIDIEQVGEKPLDSIDRATIKSVFELTDAQLSQALESFKKAEIVNTKTHLERVQFSLDNLSAKLKRQEFIIRVIEEAKGRAQAHFQKPNSYYSADVLSLSEDYINEFTEEYQKLITNFIGKELSAPRKTKIVQIALQLFAVN